MGSTRECIGGKEHPYKSLVSSAATSERVVRRPFCYRPFLTSLAEFLGILDDRAWLIFIAQADEVAGSLVPLDYQNALNDIGSLI